MHFAPSAEIFGADGLIILVVVALVLFGSTQIPKLARSLGSARKEFKHGLEEGDARPRDATDRGAARWSWPPFRPTPRPDRLAACSS